MSEMFQSAFNLPSIRAKKHACRSYNGCSNHQTRFSASMLIPNASRPRTVSSKLPDTYMAVGILHAVHELVFSDNIVPLLFPVSSVGSPESPFLSMMFCKGSRSNSHHAESQPCCKRIRTEKTELKMLQICNFPE
ncbi:hypothetical protein TNCV_2521631 [Trichonephila clavipes]|nr:hypothetical protein TNCV_2521631 [Trichonephila clavipes]